VTPVVVGEMPGPAEADDAAGGRERLVGEGLGCAPKGEQVELGPGQIAVVRNPGAVGVVSEPGCMPPVAAFESRDHGQREYYEDDDSGHGSNYPIAQIQPQLALLT
jgi:hypothetical protein